MEETVPVIILKSIFLALFYIVLSLFGGGIIFLGEVD